MAANPEISISGRRAAVTGGGGFIGARVCEALVQAGCEVSGLDSSPSAAEQIRAAGAEPVVCDITDAGQTREALEGAELVVHTAAIVGDWGSMADHVRVNVGGTVNVLEGARAAGAERVVHVSSVVVYGYESAETLDETAELRNCGIPYLDTKSASDRVARAAGAVVIRPGDVYGPRSVWTDRAFEMVRKGRLALPSGGSGRMLPVYADDLVAAILCGLQRGEPGQAYAAWNDSEEVTFGQYFDAVAEIAGARRPVRMPAPLMDLAGIAMEKLAGLRGSQPPFTRHSSTLVDRRGLVSAERARTELGWEPKVGLALGLERCAEAQRAAGLL